LPEARRAVQAGKLPRKVGMILVRHDQQYECIFSGETLSLTGARLPAPEEADERARLEERVTQVRHLLETLDLLYDTFLRSRATDDWTRELGRMQKWLQREERGRAAGCRRRLGAGGHCEGPGADAAKNRPLHSRDPGTRMSRLTLLLSGLLAL